MMELHPDLQLGWFNGWILIVILYLVYGFLLLIFPKDVVARLYDKSGRTKRQNIIINAGGILAFIYFLLLIFSPLKFKSYFFILGITVYTLGLMGFVIALFNFKNTPLDKPVTRGLYKVSRNPQQFTFLVSFFGVGITVGSWLALFIQFIASFFLHTRILAEEEACLKRYGESYRKYMKRVPRYFLFF